MRDRSLLWPDRRKKPLYGSVRINRAHPLVNGLVNCWLFNEGGGNPVDLASGLANLSITDLTNTKWAAGPAGIGIQATINAGTTRGITISPTISTTSIFTWDGLLAPSANFSDNFGTIFSQSGSTGLWMRGTPSGGFTGRMEWYGASGTIFSNANATLDGKVHHHCLTATGTSATATWYFDGSFDTSGTVTTPGITGVDSMFNDPSSDTYDGLCFFQRLWNRALSAQEVAWLAAEPYAFLSPKVVRRYFIPAVGGGITYPRLERSVRGVERGVTVGAY